MRWIVLLLLVLLAVCIGQPLHAQGAGIHRCVDRAGHPVFTDRICTDLDATPALPAGDAKTEATPSSGADRSSQLCAATLDQLRQQIVDAFAAHDPNRLAGLMLWDGYSRLGVVEQIRALGALMRQPLLEVADDGPRRVVDASPAPADLYDASRPLGPEARSLAASDSDDDGDAKTVTVVTGPRNASGASTGTRFALVPQSGCLWLRPAD